MIAEELTDDEQIAAIELEARLAYPNLPLWKAMFEFAIREGTEMLDRLNRADAACRRETPSGTRADPARREYRDAV